MVLPGFRIHHGLRFVLLCALLALAIGGLQTVRAHPSIDPLTEVLAPVGHLGGAATVIRLLPDDYAALGLGDDLLFLDVIDPYHPVQIGKLSFSSMIVDLHILGSYAYVLAAGRIHIVDFSDLSHPVEIRMLSTLAVRDIDLDDQYLYIASYQFYIYGLSNPASPVWIGTYQSKPQGEWNEVTNFGLRVVAAFPYLYLQTVQYDCYLYIYNCYIPEILDISQPSNPAKVSEPGVTPTNVRALAETQDFIFVSEDFVYYGPGSSRGILVIARADMDTLTPSAIIPHLGNDLSIQGNTLYVADEAGGIRIFDITNPLSPSELGWEPSIFDPRGIEIKNHLAFVAGGSQGLGVIDVRNPAVPTLGGGFRSVGDVDHVAIAGNYIYASSDRLDIMDVSDLAYPKVMGTYDRRGAPAVVGNTLFLAAGADGLAAIDITNPASPNELDLLVLPGTANAVAVGGDYAYVATSSGLQVVNISDPQAMFLAGGVEGIAFTQVTVSDGFVYLISGSDVIFYDISLPESPQWSFQYTMPMEDEHGETCGTEPGIARAIAVEGNRVYVLWDIQAEEPKICSISSGGMLLFEKATQNTWQLMSQTWLPYPRALDMKISNGIGYVLSGEVQILDLEVVDVVNPPYTNGISTRKFSAWVPSGSDLIADLATQDDLVVLGNYEEGVHMLQWLPIQKSFLPTVHNGP